MEVKIRKAMSDDAEVLTSVALRSKAVWGYDEEFMQRCRDELTLTSDYISGQEVYEAMLEGNVAGFYGLTLRYPESILDYMYVAPDYLRQGIGSILWDHLVNRVQEFGALSISIDADPHAEKFYRSRGADVIGSVLSGSIEGRLLPLMRYTL